MDSIHGDICGQLIIHLVDDFQGMMWCDLLKKKSDAFEALNKFEGIK